MSEVFKVAVAGLGTVGSGVVRLLQEQKDVLLKRCGRQIELTAVSDLNPARMKELNLPDSVSFYGDAREMADKASADIMIELIGGADGHSEEIRQKADLILAFGEMTWPHMLARVMLAEQIYRAKTILDGHPYHRA